MLAKILRPIPGPAGNLMPGEIHDASSWRNLMELQRNGYLRPLSDSEMSERVADKAANLAVAKIAEAKNGGAKAPGMRG